MKSKKLGQLTTKIGSGITPRGGSRIYVDEGTYLIRSQNIYNDHFEKQGLVCITDQIAEQMKNVIIKENDVLINITGNSVARTFIITKEYLPARVNQHVSIIRVNSELNPHFLYYFLIDKKTQSFLLNLARSGGTRDALTKEMLEELEIFYPDIDIQNKIVNHLNTIKYKIENLKKQNIILEKITRTIFNSWFEKFDGQKEFDDSELGKIPKDWHVSKFSKHIKIIKGKKPKGDLIKIKKDGYLPQILIETLDDEISYFTDPKNLVISKDTDTIIVMDGASSGRIAIGYSGIVGSTLAKIICDEIISPCFTFNLLKSLESQMKSNLTGSAVPHTDKDLLLESNIIIPDKKLMEVFEKMAKSNLSKIINNKNKIKLLKELHETILPRLISGEIMK